MGPSPKQCADVSYSKARQETLHACRLMQGMPAADVLFLVEGAGQGALGKNWGDGTATDPNVISSRGLSDPNPFFSALLQKPYLSQVIIGPHVYPPSISMAKEETQVRTVFNTVHTNACILHCIKDLKSYYRCIDLLRSAACSCGTSL